MVLLFSLGTVSSVQGISLWLAVPFRRCCSSFLLEWMWLSSSLWGVVLVSNILQVMVIFLPPVRVRRPCHMLMRSFEGRIFIQSQVVLALGCGTCVTLILQMPLFVLFPNARGLFSWWGLVVARQFWNSLGQNIDSNPWIPGIVRCWWGFWVLTSLQHL